MTDQIEIRHVPAEDMLPWIKTMRTSLMADPGDITEKALEFWRAVWEPDRIFGGYSGGRCVASLRTFATTLSVPAGPDRTAELRTDALTQVSVAATHRRRGILRQMLTSSLAAAHERGEAVSLLRAAEWPIYGRFGYWPTSMASDYQIQSHVGPRVLHPPAGVEVVQVEPAEALAPATSVLSRLRQREHGHIDRPQPMWERSLRLHAPAGQREPVCVLAKNTDGEVDGYAMWTANDGDWYHDRLQAQARIDEILAVTDDAQRALWHYLLSLDLVRMLRLEGYPVDLPLEWLLSDGRAARRTWTGDSEWLRILDVPAALQARRYEHTDALVLEVVDRDGGFAQGRFRLDAGFGHAECTPTSESADLQLSQRALAAIYLGGNTVRSQALAGLIDEETPGALHRLHRMFRTERAPWNATPF